tara:strand:- start:2902 stop:3096 length:195 start_codon:yes stop_codon:yes gene_type:complete
MKAWHLPLSLAELQALDDLLEVEVDSLNNALFDGRLSGDVSVEKRDRLRDIKESVTTAIDFLTD